MHSDMLFSDRSRRINFYLLAVTIVFSCISAIIFCVDIYTHTALQLWLVVVWTVFSELVILYIYLDCKNAKRNYQLRNKNDAV